jgi:hypothetical protein
MDHPNVPPTAEQAPLEELARRIRAALQASCQERRNALRRDLDIGDMLTEAQAQVTTGWKRWLRENCFLSERTALLYQQLARHRAEIEAEIERVGELSLRAAVRLISKSAPKYTPKKPEFVVAWNKATDSELTQAFTALGDKGLRRFMGVMPAEWRAEIENRVGQKRAKDGQPFLKGGAVLRKALSLAKTARTPGISAAVANSNHHEAIAALDQLNALLAAADADLNDIDLIAKPASESRRRAA